MALKDIEKQLPIYDQEVDLNTVHAMPHAFHGVSHIHAFNAVKANVPK